MGDTGQPYWWCICNDDEPRKGHTEGADKVSPSNPLEEKRAWRALMAATEPGAPRLGGYAPASLPGSAPEPGDNT